MDVDVMIEVKDGKQYKLKEFMRSVGVQAIREQLAKYIRLLREGFYSILFIHV